MTPPLSHHTRASSQRVDIMVLLRESFIQLQCVGLWPSPTWLPTSLKSRAYSLWTMCSLFFMHYFAFTELLRLFIIIEDVEDFSDNCFMLLAMLCSCSKGIIAVSKRTEILEVLRSLEMYPHKPMDKGEENIQEELNRQIRFCSFCYAGLIEVAVCTMTVTPFFRGIPFGVLPYKAWIPYDYSTPLIYWLTFNLQLLTVLIQANTAAAFDTVIYGCFMMICGQFDILKYRLAKNIDEFVANDQTILELREICEQRIINDVRYHQSIFSIAKKINTIFASVIFIQYAASSLIICISVFLLSKIPLFSLQFISLFMYVTCILSEILLFCASANEATLKCESVITSVYTTKWYRLSTRAKNSLILMMVRTLHPVIFTSGHILVLSLNSFRILLKQSYSVYTVLQQASD